MYLKNRIENIPSKNCRILKDFSSNTNISYKKLENLLFLLYNIYVIFNLWYVGIFIVLKPANHFLYNKKAGKSSLLFRYLSKIKSIFFDF